MDWKEVEIYTATDGVEILCAKLMNIGIRGFVIKDSNDFAEFLEDKSANWDYIDDDLMGLKNCETSITVYLPDNSQGAEMLIALKEMLSELKSVNQSELYGRLEMSTNSVNEQDWANNWKQYFKPFNVGEKLIVKPSWEVLEQADLQRTVLEIDPASSFGTGQHHTTRLCLEMLEKAVIQGERILDLGCGSGILSIGAMLLGAGQASAVDIEQNAVVAALDNAQKNGISGDVYKTYYGNIIENKELVANIGEEYDVITANIVADVLIAMSDIFGKFLKDKGILIVSGIITERKDEVISAIVEKGFNVIKEAEDEGWYAAMLKYEK